MFYYTISRSTQSSNDRKEAVEQDRDIETDIYDSIYNKPGIQVANRLSTGNIFLFP